MDFHNSGVSVNVRCFSDFILENYLRYFFINTTMGIKQLKNIYELFMDLPAIPRNVSLAIMYLDTFKMNWTTETMLERDNDQALEWYKAMSDRYYHDIRQQPSRG